MTKLLFCKYSTFFYFYIYKRQKSDVSSHPEKMFNPSYVHESNTDISYIYESNVKLRHTYELNVDISYINESNVYIIYIHESM